MRILHVLMILAFMSIIACSSEPVDLNGEWVAHEFTKTCVDPSENTDVSFTDGCSADASCYSMVLTDGTGSYSSTADGDISIAYTKDDLTNIFQLTMDGSGTRTGTFTASTITINYTLEGCDVEERWVRKI